MSDVVTGHGRGLGAAGAETVPSNARAMSVKGQPLNNASISQLSVEAINIQQNRLWNAGVEFVRLHPQAQLPAQGTKLAAGYDLVTPEALSFAPGERKAIPLGFALAIPDNLHGRIESRSGLALKGLVVLTGVIDADYRGELKVIMQNFSDAKHEFAAGDRVAQLVLRPTVEVPFTTVESFSNTTERDSGGFGSTGR